ncbi:MAG: AAA family ATPase [Leeuwenhoekiella sp.]
MSDRKVFNIQMRVQNIGPHNNCTLNLGLGEKGPFKVGVFSTNGSGKTSLSKQFRLLSQKSNLSEEQKMPFSEKFLSLGENAGKFEFKFYCQNENNFIDKSFNIKHKANYEPVIEESNNFIFHVFNSEYVRETIEPNKFSLDASIDGYIIGKGAIDVSKDKQSLKELEADYKDQKDIIDEEIKKHLKILTDLGIRKNTIEFKDINYENLSSIDGSNTIENESFETLKTKLKKLENIPDDLNDVSSISPFIYDLTALSLLVADLKITITPSSISAEIKEKIQTKKLFISNGLAELKKCDENKCPFCEQDLQAQQLELIDIYREYFEEAETKFRQKLDGYIDEIKKLLSLLQKKYKEYLKVESEWNKLQEYFPSFSDKRFPELQDPEGQFNWQDYIAIIEGKKGTIANPLDGQKILTVENAIQDFSKFINGNLKNSITQASTLIEQLNSTRLDTTNEILQLKRRICRAQAGLIKTKFKMNFQKVEKLNSEIIEIKKKIEDAEANEKFSKKKEVSDHFKELIHRIFQDKYSFDEDNNCLKFRNQSIINSPQDILSDGEKSIIAFCYYLAEVHRIVSKVSEYDNLFFIIDDPVSSMDFHFIYSISTILSELETLYSSLTAKNDIKLVLLTHNLEFMSILLRNNVLSKGGYVLTPGKLVKLNKELIMPYQEHLMDIYRVAVKGQSPSHTIQNSMRHVIETIKKFECPDNSYKISQFINDNEELKGCSSIHILIQDGSHGYIRSQKPILPEDIIKGCKSILRYIDARYKRQLNAIKKFC